MPHIYSLVFSDKQKNGPSSDTFPQNVTVISRLEKLEPDDLDIETGTHWYGKWMTANITKKKIAAWQNKFLSSSTFGKEHVNVHEERPLLSLDSRIERSPRHQRQPHSQYTRLKCCWTERMQTINIATFAFDCKRPGITFQLPTTIPHSAKNAHGPSKLENEEEHHSRQPCSSLPSPQSSCMSHNVSKGRQNCGNESTLTKDGETHQWRKHSGEEEGSQGPWPQQRGRFVKTGNWEALLQGSPSEFQDWVPLLTKVSSFKNTHRTSGTRLANWTITTFIFVFSAFFIWKAFGQIWNLRFWRKWIAEAMPWTQVRFQPTFTILFIRLVRAIKVAVTPEETSF